jgi:hypothetical protein
MAVRDGGCRRGGGGQVARNSNLHDHARMTPPRLATLIACCWLCSAGTGCASEAIAPVDGLAAAPADATALLREIGQQIGDAACDADAQCHTLAIGAKACGGPEAYLAWSGKVTRGAPLAELAARHRAAREIENARNRLQSNCALVPDPGAVCRPRASGSARACQAGLGGQGDVR